MTCFILSQRGIKLNFHRITASNQAFVGRNSSSAIELRNFRFHSSFLGHNWLKQQMAQVGGKKHFMLLLL